MFRPITITAVLNGWIVACGCQTVVYSSRDELLRDLDQYLRDPAGTEKRFLESALNHATVGGAVAVPPSRDELRQMARERDLYNAQAQVATDPRG